MAHCFQWMMVASFVWCLFYLECLQESSSQESCDYWPSSWRTSIFRCATRCPYCWGLCCAPLLVSWLLLLLSFDHGYPSFAFQWCFDFDCFAIFWLAWWIGLVVSLTEYSFLPIWFYQDQVVVVFLCFDSNLVMRLNWCQDRWSWRRCREYPEYSQKHTMVMEMNFVAQCLGGALLGQLACSWTDFDSVRGQESLLSSSPAWRRLWAQHHGSQAGWTGCYESGRSHSSSCRTSIFQSAIDAAAWLAWCQGPRT